MSVRDLVRRHGGAFGRAALVSLLATGAEFLLLPVLLYAGHLGRPLAFVLVQLVANVITFAGNKAWAFDARGKGHLGVQGLRQLVVVVTSGVLNTVLPTWLSTHARLEPVLAFALSNVAVYLCWNFPANRFWVYREALAPEAVTRRPAP